MKVRSIYNEFLIFLFNNYLFQAGLVFLLSPPPCTDSDWLLFLVSSAPGETQLRSAWREELSLQWEEEEEKAKITQGVKVRPD